MSWPQRLAVLLLAALAVSGLVVLPSLLAQPYAAPVAWGGAPRFSVDSAWPFVETLATRFPRRWSGSADRRAAADWLAAKLAGMGLEVHRDAFPVALGEPGPVTLENVWGTSPGAALPDEVIVALGNYDMAPTSVQAASDTAAHAGTLLELARVLHASPHRRTFVFLFTDGEEWGMLGARRFARTRPGGVVAALSIEDLDVGTFRALAVDGVGQVRGFAPMWLRGLAADAAAREGWPTREVDPLFEWLQRSVLVSFTDQGPFLGAGIQSVQLGGRGDDPALQDRVYHLPGDTIDHVRPASVLAYGRIQERILRAIDAMPRVPREPSAYLRLGPDRAAPGGALLLAQVGVFAPLVAAFAFRAAKGRLSGEGLVREGVELGGILLVLLAGLGAVVLAPRIGLMPLYELYPPPPRHPLLTHVLWLPVLFVAAVVGVAAIAVRRATRPLFLPRPGGRAEGIAASLLWLLVVAAVALLDNPFEAVTFLLLPATLWVWVGPARSPAGRQANAVLVALGFGTVLAVFAEYALVLQIGGHILWYFFMALAYGQFTRLRVMLGLATVAIGLRLFALGALAPDAPRIGAR